MKTILYLFLYAAIVHEVSGQGFVRETYHDANKKNRKEVYQVKDTIGNILHGNYTSYFLNGNVESRGQFTDNETTGVWEFFYETGNLKMRGILKHNANYGLWEYFYESGQKSMQGNVNGKNREGEWIAYYENGQVKEVGEYVNSRRQGVWKSFFEDGALKGEIDYANDTGRYTEYYRSGKILAEGPRTANVNVGLWRFFDENGNLASEGQYVNGKKDSEWRYYYPDGKLKSRGNYVRDQRSGLWEDYLQEGSISTSGAFSDGKKTGVWRSFYPDAKPRTEIAFTDKTGEYREYYPSGKLKSRGNMLNEKRHGQWMFFYEDGRKEGECHYNDDKGIYHGYFPNGTLQTKGPMNGELKTGTWEIYQEDGTLSGYYRPFYDNERLGQEIVSLARTSDVKKTARHGKKLNYFQPRVGEFRGLIVGGNPAMMLVGRLPLAVEFYVQERLGHEFAFTGIRDPFFKSDMSIPAGDKFERGYSVSIKQKLYNPLSTGMWYFGHEIRFTNYGHFINQPISSSSTDLFTFSSIEQRIEWGMLLGYRISQSNVRKGFTIDAFISGDVGYRGFDVDPDFSSHFADISQSRLSTSFYFGLNFGNVFSFR